MDELSTNMEHESQLCCFMKQISCQGEISQYEKDVLGSVASHMMIDNELTGKMVVSQLPGGATVLWKV